MSDEFKDLLAAFDDEKKEARPAAEAEAPAADADADGAAVSGAAAAGVPRRPLAPGGRPMMKPGAAPGVRPAAAKTPAASPPPVAPVSPAAPAVPAVPAAAKVAVPLAVTPAAGGAASGSPLLILVLVLAGLGVLLGLGILLKVNSLYGEMAGLQAQMKLVKEAADRSWKVQCGVFTPSPTQRAQEYQMIYEEKDGKLVRRQTIIRPLEE